MFVPRAGKGRKRAIQRSRASGDSLPMRYVTKFLFSFPFSHMVDFLYCAALLYGSGPGMGRRIM